MRYLDARASLPLPRFPAGSTGTLWCVLSLILYAYCFMPNGYTYTCTCSSHSRSHSHRHPPVCCQQSLIPHRLTPSLRGEGTKRRRIRRAKPRDAPRRDVITCAVGASRGGWELPCVSGCVTWQIPDWSRAITCGAIRLAGEYLTTHAPETLHWFAPPGAHHVARNVNLGVHKSRGRSRVSHISGRESRGRSRVVAHHVAVRVIWPLYAIALYMDAPPTLSLR